MTSYLSAILTVICRKTGSHYWWQEAYSGLGTSTKLVGVYQNHVGVYQNHVGIYQSSTPPFDQSDCSISYSYDLKALGVIPRLNLADCLEAVRAKILADLNLAVLYGIAIGIYACKKY